MEIEGICFEGNSFGTVLASDDGQVNIARILQRWTEPRRAALLFVLVGETPFADVYAEEELFTIFPDAPVVLRRGRNGSGGTGLLRVYVADTRGTVIYLLDDPRGSGRSSRVPIDYPDPSLKVLRALAALRGGEPESRRGSAGSRVADAPFPHPARN